MRRPRAAIAVPLALVALALPLAAGCGGDDDDAPPNPGPPAGADTPAPNAAPPGVAGQLPPEFLECMADRGYEIQSPEQIHSAPPDVLQACFGSAH